MIDPKEVWQAFKQWQKEQGIVSEHEMFSKLPRKDQRMFQDAADKLNGVQRRGLMARSKGGNHYVGTNRGK